MAYTTIDDGSEYFQTALYTGNGTAIGSGGLTITNDGNSDLKPDWIWHKKRGNAESHAVADSNRGTNKGIFPNENNAESTGGNEYVNSFNTDGFTVGNVGWANDSSQTYVAWQWKANGGTTSSNNDGSITTTVQANTTAGFSIVTYTGNATNGATIGHGLGAVPQVIIKKNRADNGTEWNVYHHSIGNTKSLFLNTTEAATTESAYNNTSPTSSIQTINGSGANNGDGDNMIAYFFTPIKGYSKFGSYIGNGAQDGTFVYTGFKPAFILIKRTDTSGKNWYIADSTRSPNNITKAFLSPNTTAAEDTSGDATDAYFDILSNGFKLRQDFSHLNASGSTQIYMAFAEHPFVSSKGVPTTAR